MLVQQLISRLDERHTKNTSAIRKIRAPYEKYERHTKNTSAIRKIRAPYEKYERHTATDSPKI
ncbi:hypothetical protein QUF49_17165 [Fictibacillus sp. b24]|uniref:hypothetical protein n=1 Tax=Fictibacillus sp. b24 TaxID=3055863 RepID=UPI0025A13B63|nr:hypothetical protein [Fictibacillus sp. b24]MDM5317743.1 hypothetical protein [Fictibacillus sp. b24]